MKKVGNRDHVTPLRQPGYLKLLSQSAQVSPRHCVICIACPTSRPFQQQGILEISWVGSRQRPLAWPFLRKAKHCKSKYSSTIISQSNNGVIAPFSVETKTKAFMQYWKEKRAPPLPTWQAVQLILRKQWGQQPTLGKALKI